MDIKDTIVTVDVIYRFDYNLEDWGTYFEDKTEVETKETLIEDAQESIRDGASAFSATATIAAPNGEVLVAWDDIVDAFLLAMHAEGLDHDTKARIITTVRDAVDNND